MRSLLFLSLLSFPALAQIDTGNGAIAICDETHLANGGNVQCGSLDLNAPVTFVSGSPALDLQVQNDAIIDFAINLSGANSLPSGGAGDDFFGEAGPGGTNGGGTGFLNPQPATDGGNVGDSGACGAGGGGGGYVFAGTAGLNCPPQNGGAGGALLASIFVDSFTGGRGGGAGGLGTSSNAVGGGGGGGGAIRMRVGGNVTISGNISADGGAGGDSANDDGAGGGGSGGLIWIQALGNITHSGVMSAAGGAGGNAPGAGANGSAGSRGAIRLEDLDGVITNTGTIPGYAQTDFVNPAVTSSSSSLKSDISCGTIKPSEEKVDTLFQLIAGFMLVELFCRLVRKASFRKLRKA